MIALDTNVLLRYLVQDDPDQGGIAARFIEEELSSANPGFVTVTALLELDWTLRKRYGFQQARVRAVLLKMVAEPKLVVEHSLEVKLALTSTVGDFADNILHQMAKSHGSRQTVTFDREFSRLDGVTLLTNVLPEPPVSADIT